MKKEISITKSNMPVRPKEDFLVFGSPLIEADEIEEVVSSLRLGWIGTGPKVRKFEELFRDYKGSSFSTAVNSCTAAIHLSLLAAGIGKGDEVISTAMTFCATINTIIHSGAVPVLADCQRDTMNIDPEDIEKRITARTKSILVVHFAGRPCNMDAITDIAKRHQLIVIEDCAHAIETEYKGKKAGTIGDLGCFSFYVTKNIITGEGGMVISNNEEYDRKVKICALHGMSQDAWNRFDDKGYKHYQVVECGYKYNMMDLQAAIGLHQIKRIDDYWERRKKVWEKYNEAFSDLPIDRPSLPEKNTRHAYHLYSILVDKKKSGMSRDDFLNAIRKENIGAGVHYLSIPEHPYYKKTFGWNSENYPNAQYIGRSTASLPLSPKLSEKDVEDVITAVRKIFKRS